MIATPWFVYLHLHKSGGTFVNECLLRFVPGAQQLGYHLPRRMIPKPLRSLPVLGFVRNPWAYYVSWYSFQAGKPQPNHLFRCASRNGTLGLQRTVHNLLTLGSDPVGLEEVLAGLPDEYTNAGLNLTRSALAPIRGSGFGFYSFLYHYLFDADGPPPLIGRSERLRQDLPARLESLGVPVSADMLDFIAAQGDRNTSEHAPYVSYYDEALKELVAQRDASLIRACGIEFNDATMQ